MSYLKHCFFLMELTLAFCSHSFHELADQLIKAHIIDIIKELPTPEIGTFKSNKYIDICIILQIIGEKKSVLILKDVASFEEDSQAEKVIVLCRMLFTLKATQKFHRAEIGQPFFLGRTTSSDWPLDPITIVNGVPFYIVNQRILAGLAESSSHYLKYCIDNCKWNNIRFAMKDLPDREKALNKLLNLNVWKIKLSDDERELLIRQIK